MNNKMLTIASVSCCFGCWSIRNNPNGTYADEIRDTETETRNKAKELGSDASTNVNCGDNDIDSPSAFDVQVCGTATVDLGVLDGMDAGRAPD